MAGARVWKLAALFFLTAVLAAGCLGRGRSPAPTASPGGKAQSAPASLGQVTVYFSDQNAERLKPVKRPVPETGTRMEAAVNALLGGPRPEENLVGTMPRGTRLLGISVKETTAVVNLSHEFRTNHPGGSTGEIMTLYALTNTITEFPGIKRVVIWLDGKPVDTYIHLDISGGVARREELIGQ